MKGSWFTLWFLALPREARGVFAVVCGLLSLLGLFLLSNLWVYIAHSWSDISSSEPKIARIKGYQLAHSQTIELSSETSRALNLVSFESEAGESQSGAKLQQVLRGFAEDAGLTVRGSQLVSRGEKERGPDGFLVLNVSLEMRGLPSGLDMFLSEVYDHSPLLNVAQLSIVKVRDRRSSRRVAQSESTPEQNLDVSVRITALLVSA